MWFRNLRRNPRSSSTGLSFSPPIKKKKLGNHSGYFPVEPLDEETYILHVTQINKHWSKKSRTKTALLSLMNETLPNRRKWILETRTSVSEVLEKFPTLVDFDMVRMVLLCTLYMAIYTCVGLQLVGEFSAIAKIQDPVQVFMNNWSIWIPKLFQKVQVKCKTHKKILAISAYHIRV